MAMSRTRSFSPVTLLALLLCFGLAAPAWAGSEEAARKNAIKGLGKKLKKLAKDPRVEKKQPEVMKVLESLETLGGHEAGRAALYGVPIDIEPIRDRIFTFVEKVHHKDLVKPLVEIINPKNKTFRRDADAKARTAHALSVVADPKAIEPLSALIRTDEDNEVVASAADALATFAGAELKDRKIAVKELVDVLESTYNLAHSFNPDHIKLKSHYQKKWRAYGKSVRAALQSLTGQQLTRPQEWRRWWNDYKKAKSWKDAKPRDK